MVFFLISLFVCFQLGYFTNINYIVWARSVWEVTRVNTLVLAQSTFRMSHSLHIKFHFIKDPKSRT